MKFDDKWTGPDKNKHIIGGFAISLVVSLVFGAEIGFAVGAAVAFAKEFVYDLALKKGTCSFQDLVVTLGGSAVGAFAPDFFRVVA